MKSVEKFRFFSELLSSEDRLLVEWKPYTLMPKKPINDGGVLLQGTLDMLILKAVLLAPAHGHTIAHSIESSSEDVLQVEHGSLYPALHRLEDKGLIASFSGTSENNRRAKYYRITPAGKKHSVSMRATHCTWRCCMDRARAELPSSLRVLCGDI